MGYGLASSTRDNFGRVQKYATINIKKQLEKTAMELEVDAKQVIAKKLKEVYISNVQASFTPRTQHSKEIAEFNASQRQAEMKYNVGKSKEQQKRFRRRTKPYKHTGKLLESIDVAIEEHRVKIVIKPIPYPNETGRKYTSGKKQGQDKTITTKDVHEFLDEGTKGGGGYKFIGSDKQEHWAYNAPTPKHEFEAHTQLHMKSYLSTLDLTKYKKVAKYQVKKERS